MHTHILKTKYKSGIIQHFCLKGSVKLVGMNQGECIEAQPTMQFYAHVGDIQSQAFYQLSHSAPPKNIPRIAGSKFAAGGVFIWYGPLASL